MANQPKTKKEILEIFDEKLSGGLKANPAYLIEIKSFLSQALDDTIEAVSLVRETGVENDWLNGFNSAVKFQNEFIETFNK